MVSKSVIFFISLGEDNFEYEDFFTASDSPVRVDWLTCRLLSSIIRTSAGSSEPADKKTISPLTSSFIGISIFILSRSTVAVVATRLLSFAAALFERYSCTNSRIVLALTRIKITTMLA